MSGAVSSSEPTILAHAKRRLFPDPHDEKSYAVVDTQFAMDEWLQGQPIPAEIQDTLAPYNHVRLGSGYPDLVGVRSLEPEFLAGESSTHQPPLIAIEAKGQSNAGGINVAEGIIQAYDRLREANAVYVAAPQQTITPTTRSLAHELNVGILGVTNNGDVTPVEVPRIVGNRVSDDASAIRFQATAHGVTDQSFGLNHPKNYLAYPLAVYHPEPTNKILGTHVVEAVDDARHGAEFLGLIEQRPNRVVLTSLGEEVVRFALHRYESVDTALRSFEDWQRSQRRFCDIAPEWGLVTRHVVWTYPATQLLVEELQRLHDTGNSAPSLIEFVEWLHESRPTFTIELFIRGSTAVRRRVLTEDGNLTPGSLTDGTVFHSPTVFQLKAMLYHSGILTERGAEPHRLDPTTDVWRLREPLDQSASYTTT